MKYYLVLVALFVAGCAPQPDARITDLERSIKSVNEKLDTLAKQQREQSTVAMDLIEARYLSLSWTLAKLAATADAVDDRTARAWYAHQAENLLNEITLNKLERKIENPLGARMFPLPTEVVEKMAKMQSEFEAYQKGKLNNSKP